MKSDKFTFDILCILYLALIFLGIVSVINPVWFQELSSSGESNEAQPYIQAANLSMYSNDWLNASLLYQQALQIDEDDIETYGNLGIAHTQMGNFSEALACYEHVKLLSEGLDTMAYFNYFESMGALEKAIGDNLKQVGKDYNTHYSNAMNYYKNAIEIMPYKPVLFYKYAQLLMSENMDSLSIESYRKGISLNLDKNSYYFEALTNNYLTAIMDNDTVAQHKIEKQFKSDINWDKYDSEIFINDQLNDSYLASAFFDLGVLYSRNHQNELAREQFENAFKINPELKNRLNSNP